jgi:hypothetical protein
METKRLGSFDQTNFGFDPEKFDPIEIGTLALLVSLILTVVSFVLLYR